MDTGARLSPLIIIIVKPNLSRAGDNPTSGNIKKYVSFNPKLCVVQHKNMRQPTASLCDQ